MIATVKIPNQKAQVGDFTNVTFESHDEDGLVNLSIGQQAAVVRVTDLVRVAEGFKFMLTHKRAEDVNG